MASRYLNQFQYTLEKDTVTLFGTANIGASGAVSGLLGGGIASITKQATAGQYVITLEDSWSHFFALEAQIVDDAVSAIARVQVLQDPATIQATVAAKTIKIQCLDYAGVAANPISGAQLSFKIVLRKSSVGPFDT